MKKIKIYLAVLAVGAAVLIPKAGHSQKYQGQVVVGANGAFSMVGLLMTSLFNGLDNATGLSTNVTPGMHGTMDFGVTDRFSIGVAYFNQTGTAKWTQYTDTMGFTQTGDFHYRLIRQNAAVRAMFHMGDNDDLDTYFGLRFGWSFWSTQSNATYTGLDFGKFADHFWPQAVFGVRYFFIPAVGVNAELALGFPYYLSAGVNFRFGGGN